MISKKARLAFLFLLIAGLLIFYFYPCLSIKFIRLPEYIIEKSTITTENIYFLYGSLCLECSSGNYFRSLKKRT